MPELVCGTNRAQQKRWSITSKIRYGRSHDFCFVSLSEHSLWRKPCYEQPMERTHTSYQQSHEVPGSQPTLQHHQVCRHCRQGDSATLTTVRHWAGTGKTVPRCLSIKTCIRKWMCLVLAAKFWGNLLLSNKYLMQRVVNSYSLEDKLLENRHDVLFTVTLTAPYPLYLLKCLLNWIDW